MDRILEIIDAALRRKGLSDAAASKLAVGHPSLIKNMRIPREGEKRYNLPALQKLSEVLDLEFHFGPPRITGPIQQFILDGIEYAHIPLHAASLSASAGSNNGDNTIIDHLAFRRDWLRRIGVSPDRACLARVERESMSPTIFPGDMVLIDTAHTEPPVRKRTPADQRRASIYAFVEGGQARVKRIERPESGVLFLVSDNPDFPPELRAGAQLEQLQLAIIGKVVWWGHTAG